MGGKLSMRMNVFLFYRHTINHIDTGYNSNSFNYRTNLNVSYQFNNKLAAEFLATSIRRGTKHRDVTLLSPLTALRYESSSGIRRVVSRFQPLTHLANTCCRRPIFSAPVLRRSTTAKFPSGQSASTLPGNLESSLLKRSRRIIITIYRQRVKKCRI